MTDTSTVPEPSQANRITWFAVERPVEGTVHVKPPITVPPTDDRATDADASGAVPGS